MTKPNGADSEPTFKDLIRDALPDMTDEVSMVQDDSPPITCTLRECVECKPLFTRKPQW